jgi:ribosomal protein L23
VANVAKKAKKPDVEKAYEELFKAGTFATAVPPQSPNPHPKP